MLLYTPTIDAALLRFSQGDRREPTDNETVAMLAEAIIAVKVLIDNIGRIADAAEKLAHK